MAQKSDTPLSVRFGQRIRELRESKGWLQIDLAYHCRLDQAFVSRLENGKVNLSLESIERLAEGLEITVGELFSGL